MSHQKKLFNSFFLIIVLIFINGCRPVESQNFQDIFSSTNNLPHSLQRLSNQDYEIRTKENEIVARTIKDAGNPELLKIAVIDNGIDLVHPDLIDQIDFDINEGHVVGAGYDFIGDDSWASANLISSRLFAFGAKQIENGLIVGAIDRPLKLLKDMNDEFWNYLSLEIQKNVDLKQSLFTKLNRKNFSIVGAYRLLETENFSQESYDKLKKNGELISVQNKDKMLENNKLLGIQAIKKYIENPWYLNPELGHPYEVEDSLPKLEGADQFWMALKKSLDQTSPQLPFTMAFSRYVDFTQQRDPLFDRNYQMSVIDLLKDISQALSYNETYRQSLDPLYKLQTVLRELNINESVFQDFDKNNFFSKGQSESESESEILKLSLQRIESLMTFKLNQGHMSFEAEKYLIEGMNIRGALREVTKWVFNDRILDHQINKREAFFSQYRKYFVRTQHPYLSQDSQTTTHGSHVAGKIALADPNVRIIPIRVTTQAMEISPASLDKMKADFKNDFQHWLAEPLVFKAIQFELQNIYPELDFSGKFHEETVSKIMAKLEKTLDVFFQKNAIEYKFLLELKKAITYVGNKKVKLANISLGISFEKTPTSFSVNADNDKFALDHAFDFLRYEYYKYRMAEVIQKEAPQTLFVISSGNDGKWLDGQSRSALPVDISSPWLERFQDELKITAPNNLINNILGVGSLDNQQRISSFTNIPINVRTPFILAEGESVLSAIRSTDLEAIDQILEKKMPELWSISLFDFTKADAQKWMRENMSNLSNLSVNDRTQLENQLSINLVMSKKLLGKLLNVIKLHLFIRYPEHRARLSGTSMASPTVVSIIAQMIFEKSKKLGMSISQIYAHPEFTPEKLIEDVFLKAEPLNPRSNGISLKKLLGDRKQSPDKSSLELEKLLDEFIMRGKNNNSLKLD